MRAGGDPGRQRADRGLTVDDPDGVSGLDVDVAPYGFTAVTAVGGSSVRGIRGETGANRCFAVPDRYSKVVERVQTLHGPPTTLERTTSERTTARWRFERPAAAGRFIEMIAVHAGIHVSIPGYDKMRCPPGTAAVVEFGFLRVP